MAIPFTVDISAFYGEPDFREQDSGTIVDRRKTLNLHKVLETPINTKKRRPKRTTTKSAGAGESKIRPGVAIGFKDTGGAVDFKDARGAIGFKDTGGAIGFNSAGCNKPGGALAFNEQQLMNELTGLKKGGALGTIAATVIPALIQMAPQIISSVKDLIKCK